MDEFSDNYYKLLTGEFSGINLTRITNREEFQLKQIEDSIQPLFQAKTFKENILKAKFHVDVGFGGGFPLLPLAYCLPEVQFVGFEARNKKVSVVNDMAQRLGLKNVKCFHQRVENIVFDQPCTVSFKAVGKVNDFLSKIYTEERIQVYFYKALNFYNLEKEQIEQAKMSWKVIEESEIDIQDTQKRYIIGFENKKVPCGTINKIKKISMSEISAI
jgi:16S rRNA (guanine527-N7)-methyltransferase